MIGAEQKESAWRPGDLRVVQPILFRIFLDLGPPLSEVKQTFYLYCFKVILGF